MGIQLTRHPYIVTYEDCFIEDGHLFVAMEFAGGGPTPATHRESFLDRIAWSSRGARVD